MNSVDLESQLSPEHRAWFKAQIDKGRFPSVQDGLNTIIGWFKHEIDDRLPKDDDLSWIKPLLDEAEADVAHGRVRPMHEVHADVRGRLLADKQ